MARPEGLEPPAYWFEASRSIQMSYGRALPHAIIRIVPEIEAAVLDERTIVLASGKPWSEVHRNPRRGPERAPRRGT